MARPRSANRRRFVLVLIVLTSLTLITLDSRSDRSGPLGTVGRVAHTIVSPVQRATSAVAHPVGDWWSGVIDSGSLKRQNRKLRSENARLEDEQNRWRVAIQHNDELKKLLNLPLLDRSIAVVARVVDRD